jgi:hypothetical protein
VAARQRRAAAHALNAAADARVRADLAGVRRVAGVADHREQRVAHARHASVAAAVASRVVGAAVVAPVDRAHVAASVAAAVLLAAVEAGVGADARPIEVDEQLTPRERGAEEHDEEGDPEEA